jgi:arylsulfatase A-like enzyme
MSKEEMTTPLIMQTEGLQDQPRENISIMDITPTIVKVLGLKTPKEWTGTAIF